MSYKQDFKHHKLDEVCGIWEGRLPDTLLPGRLDELWNLHPDEFHEIMMHGRLVKTPRWQQAFGKDYHYTGKVNKALPIPPKLQGFAKWSRDAVDARLNGMLLNWYDGSMGHYIGAHRDSTKEMVARTPIVTISLGETRTFRLRPWRAKGYLDFEARHGTVFVMPYETNLAWTHEVPKQTKCQGRRISITMRAFL
jgi:alkylated DNA repair dioxygenase AlkB